MTTARRVLDRCAALTAYSASPDHLERTYLTPQHAAANTAVAGWMRDAGLDTETDAAGNLWGRRAPEPPGTDGARQEPGTRGVPALVLGSHLDTVPDAGAFDGMLGVVLAIAVAERLRDVALPFALEVVGFWDEEGARFGTALMGSKAVAGQWDAAWWDRPDADGVTVREAFERFGLAPDRIGEAARHPEDLVGYLEAHIEQGPRLEAADLPLGYVTSIAGARRFVLTLTGEARHAGGTPYERRKDALAAASEVVLAAERLAREAGALATVGDIGVEPGAVNVIPGRARLTLDVRAVDDAARDALVAAIEAAGRELGARRGVAFEIAETHSAPSAVCSDRLSHAIADGIRAARSGEHTPDVPGLWSPAGHDAMAMAAVTEVGMLFVRCHDGISHHPAESVREDDVAVALDAFEAAVFAVARGTTP
ncbi:allantoate amidohydrolase [Myceligenerans pegani]|uniref:Allantoate amidohydrolase n=1 Tax=Myceligenerans pegani TaxID=2776917 RepID=A0ABR9N2D1_9MICO|nr:allantoate amidohydrolase [Myceligenerans sp. TRM 65318]MBE1877805.1 allantoate amidohydrolase [Myceligenerans sp. TRM 65318]MBE3020076.1 allantoate amidohydrolase [Myceligenerans sp. TRM 65318]